MMSESKNSESPLPQSAAQLMEPVVSPACLRFDGAKAATIDLNNVLAWESDKERVATISFQGDCAVGVPVPRIQEHILDMFRENPECAKAVQSFRSCSGRLGFLLGLLIVFSCSYVAASVFYALPFEGKLLCLEPTGSYCCSFCRLGVG